MRLLKLLALVLFVSCENNLTEYQVEAIKDFRFQECLTADTDSFICGAYFFIKEAEGVDIERVIDIQDFGKDKVFIVLDIDQAEHFFFLQEFIRGLQ